MELEKSKDDMFEKFTWKIENFSCLKTEEKLYSEPFILGGYPWRILLFPQGNNERRKTHISIYLDAVETANMSKGWSRDVKFKLIAFNQVHSEMTITKEADHKFNASEKDWGFKDFMYLTKFQDFIVEDACIFGAEIFVNEMKHENPIAALLTSGHISEGPDQNMETRPIVEPTKHIDVDLFSSTDKELIDFRGFGQIEKAFIPLLDEVCAQHPSLIECQKERSLMFTTWAFAALGRVLYFLKTRKVKDMNVLAGNVLQTLWEELDTCRFDLAWLKPHVQSILAEKDYVKKTIQVKKMKEDVVVLELEVERLNTKSVITKLSLEKARDSLKALHAQDFKNRDLDAELGYGSP